MKHSQLIDLVKNPIKTFNFFWATADTDDELHCYNFNLFKSLNTDKDLFCFYIDYSSKSNIHILNTYIDIINTLLTQNRTLTQSDFNSLTEELKSICQSTHYFKLHSNKSLQKLQLSYNAIYEDKKYEQHNFNNHLSIIFRCLSKYYSIFLILENGHLIEKHIVMLLSSFLLSKPNLSILFSFPKSKLSLFDSLNKFYSLIKLHHYLSKEITVTPPSEKEFFNLIETQSNYNEYQSNSVSLIYKKSAGSIFLMYYLLNNPTELNSSFFQTESKITSDKLLQYIFNQFDILTQKCLLLASLESSPFNLYDICQFYNADYENIKANLLAKQLIVQESSYSHIDVVRNDYFQFFLTSIPTNLINFLSTNDVNKLHHDHITFCIQHKKCFSSFSASYCLNSYTNTSNLMESSHDFFSQLMLEAYSSVHLEQFKISYSFFVLIMTFFKQHFIKSPALHFDISYNLLLTKRDSFNKDIRKELDYCYSIAQSKTEKSLLSLFYTKTLHKEEFSFQDIAISASDTLQLQSISLGILPLNKFFIPFKLITEYFKISFIKIKKKLKLPHCKQYSYKDFLILGQITNTLLLISPSFMLDFISLIKLRISEQSMTQENSFDFIKLISYLKKGNISKIESSFNLSLSKDLYNDFNYNNSLLNLMFVLLIYPLKFGLQKSRQTISQQLSTTPPTDHHYWFSFIIFQLYFQYFQGVPIKSIKQTYELYIFLFKNNCHISPSSTIAEHINLYNSILDLFLQNSTFDAHSFLSGYNDLFKKSHYSTEKILKLVAIFLCFYKHDFKMCISICREIEGTINDYLIGIFYPLFCFYYSVSLFFEYVYSDIKSEDIIQLLDTHVNVIRNLYNQNLNHFKSYLLILESLKLYLYNDTAGHKLILEVIDLTKTHKQPLLTLIAYEIAAIYYKKIDDKENIQKYINQCITEYKHLNYDYKAFCLSRHYCSYLFTNDNKKISFTESDNIFHMLKTDPKLNQSPDVVLAKMFDLIFRYIDFDHGYILKIVNNKLVSSNKISSNQVVSLISYKSFKELPQFIQIQCNKIAYQKELLYLPSAQSMESFLNEPYLIKNNIFSTLGIPLLNKDKSMFGIFYFEKKDTKTDLSKIQLKTIHNYNYLFDLIVQTQFSKQTIPSNQ